MAKPLTTNSLIKTIKRRAMLPTDQVTFSTQDFIDIINEEMNVSLMPFLLSTHEEYLVYSVDIPLSQMHENRVRIPSRALGNKLRGAAYVDNNTIYELTRVSIDNLAYFQNQFLTNYFTYSYYLQNDELVITAARPSASYLRLYFYLRPSSLVEDKYAGVVKGINTTTGEITLDKIPTNFSVDRLFDFTECRIPNKLLTYDVAAVSINNTTKTIVFDPEKLPTNLKVGDYITIAEETIVPQIPVDLHPLLAEKVALHCVNAIGDQQAIQAVNLRIQQLEKSLVDIIDNRTEDAPEKLNNLHSPLRQTYNRRFRRFY